jgi:hypothetical protein
MRTRAECVAAMHSIVTEVECMADQAEFTEADGLRFDALAAEFDVLDLTRLAIEQGVRHEDVPTVVAAVMTE